MPNNIKMTLNSRVLLIGGGFMAREYLKVLACLGNEVIIVGRSDEKIQALKRDYPNFEYFSGGLNKFLEQHSDIPEFAINAASINQLRSTSILLMDAGVKYIMLEKPGELTLSGLNEIKLKSIECSADVVIAYNRRYYSSISVLKEQVEIDGGITSAHFEFTEWIHTIDPNIYDSEALKKWIISNSSHVIDTVFSLIGIPKEINAFVGGKDAIAWHPSGSIFIGSGISENNIPFTYHSNWEGPGRWAIEISTRKRRFFLKPMEKLQQQVKGAVQIIDIDLEDQLDKDFKSGLYMQTKSFLNHDCNNTIDEQIKAFPYYNLIGGYEG